MSLKSEIRIGKSRFFKNYSISYKAYGNLMGILLPDVANTFLNTSLIKHLSSTESSIDIKGATQSSASSPAKEEILSIYGKIPQPGSLNQDSRSYPEESFSAALTSTFKGFGRAKHLEYLVKENRTGNLPRSVYIDQIAKIIPVKLEIITATLEFIRPKKILGMGVSPTLVSIFRLFATREKVGVEIEVLNSSHLDLNPPTLHEFMLEFSEALEPCISFNIFRDFYRELGV
ncbi:MAG: hypothetical protein R3A13_06230 [Bdellovibrionota bacterium]